MNRRKMCSVLGCLVIVAGLVSTAEAGGRKRPKPKPTPSPTPAAGSRVTVINKTGLNLFTYVYVAPPFPGTVGQANAVGAKLVNAGSTVVFNNLKPGRNEIEMYDAAFLNLSDPSSKLPMLPATQSVADNVEVKKDQNTTVEATIEPGTNWIVIIPK
jgi:hypothetical protein